MTVKMKAPDYDQRELPDYNKNYVKHTYYEEVKVIDGIAYVNNRDSVQLLLGEGFSIIPAEIPKKLEKPGKPELKPEAGKRKARRKRKKKKLKVRVIHQD